jgi:hypothetical protein
VLPAVQFSAPRGQAQALFDGSRPATSTTDAAGRIHLTITHAPSP